MQYWHLGDLGAPHQTCDSEGKNKFLEETARPQNQLWRKKGLTLINYVANFTSATPIEKDLRYTHREVGIGVTTEKDVRSKSNPSKEI